MKLYTAKEASEYIKEKGATMSSSMLRYYMRKGQVKAAQMVGDTWVFTQKELDRFIRNLTIQ